MTSLYIVTCLFNLYSGYIMQNAVLYESRAGFKIARRNINNLRQANVCLVAQLCPTLCDSMDCSPPSSSDHGDSPGKNTGVGCHFLFQGIFPTQGLNPGLLHCRRFFTAEPPGKPIVFLLQLIDTSVPSDTSCTLVCSQLGHPLTASLLLGITPSVKVPLKTFTVYRLCEVFSALSTLQHMLSVPQHPSQMLLHCWLSYFGSCLSNKGTDNMRAMTMAILVLFQMPI